MRVAYIAAILALAVCTVSPTLTAQRMPAGPIAADCNRACLGGLINPHLDAVLAHDSKGLPLSTDVKYTEQEQIMSVGDGFRKSVTGRGNYNHYFADPVAGRVGWMGTMHRWFPLIEKRGGTVAQIKLTNGEVADMSSFAGRISSIHFTEAFRIENNLIRRVEMIGTGVPYHFNSAWRPVLSGK
jgi:hypothetical protein